MEKQMLGARDLMQILCVSESKSYEFIREMNRELQEQGFLVVRGKVPRAFVEEKFYGVRAE